MIDDEEHLPPLENSHWSQVLHNVRRDIHPMILFLQDLAITAMFQVLEDSHNESENKRKEKR